MPLDVGNDFTTKFFRLNHFDIAAELTSTFIIFFLKNPHFDTSKTHFDNMQSQDKTAVESPKVVDNTDVPNQQPQVARRTSVWVKGPAKVGDEVDLKPQSECRSEKSPENPVYNFKRMVDLKYTLYMGTEDMAKYYRRMTVAKSCTVENLGSMISDENQNAKADESAEKYDLALFIPASDPNSSHKDIKILVEQKNFCHWDIIEASKTASNNGTGRPTLLIELGSMVKDELILEYIKATQTGKLHLDKNSIAMFIRMADAVGDEGNLKRLRAKVGPFLGPRMIAPLYHVGGFGLEIRKILLECFIQGEKEWDYVGQILAFTMNFMDQLENDDLVHLLNVYGKGLDEMNLRILLSWAMFGSEEQYDGVIEMIPKVKHIKNCDPEKAMKFVNDNLHGEDDDTEEEEGLPYECAEVVRKAISTDQKVTPSPRKRPYAYRKTMNRFIMKNGEELGERSPRLWGKRFKMVSNNEEMNLSSGEEEELKKEHEMSERESPEQFIVVRKPAGKPWRV